MEPLEFKLKTLFKKKGAAPKRSLTAITRVIPRGHIVLAGALTFGLILITSLPSETAQASRQAKQLPIPALQETPLDSIQKHSLAYQAEPTEDSDHIIVKEEVKPGDSLSRIFARAGLSDKDMFALVHSSNEAKDLSKIYPGHKLTFKISKDKQLLSLTQKLDKLNSKEFSYNGSTFEHTHHSKKPIVKIASRQGEIKTSLYIAGKESGLDEQLTMELAGIFGWDIDFALDMRKGDTFQIVYEEKFLDGERIGAGHVLAAEFVNQGTSFKAVRYVDENGDAQYYSPEGKAMRKAFLLAPLDFRRISSNFNPKRLHPITKRVKPHRGTDYAANRGTPVWASGDGKVIASGYTKSNGNYIVIQHGGEVKTKYLHLHKRKVKTGQRVKQKQIIGSVGSTGLSTAPHLHYEFLLNGVHRNPRTIVQKLPKAKSIPQSEMARFLGQTRPILAQLNKTTQLAATNSNTTKSL